MTTQQHKYLYGLAAAIALILMLFLTTDQAHAATVGQTSITRVVTKSASTQDVIWTKASKASGYQVACKAGSGRYKSIKLVSGAGTLRLRVTNRMPYVSYTYAVRAYRLVNGKRQYGAWAYKTAMLNKEVAIYGKEVPYTTYGRFYKSYSASKRNMKTITVKTWDYKNGKSGTKITRTWALTVHKRLASQVKKMFREIYKDSGKFPIHSLGGWRWDGGSRTEHADGTAIDINPDENPYIVGGRVVVGVSYQPGKNPYSIARNSKVAKILNKYGFYQGIWSNSQDYMHFSYFGT